MTKPAPGGAYDGRVVYVVDIDRVVVSGAAADSLAPSDVNSLVEAAVGRHVSEVSDAGLPRGRTMRASVRIDGASLAGGGPAVAEAVAHGVARAIAGGSSG